MMTASPATPIVEGVYEQFQEKLDYEPESISGKCILITGGTTGIGRAIALVLAGRGARVMIFGRHQRELRDALADISPFGEVQGLTADQASHEDVMRVFEETDRRFDTLDVLINNAAVAAEAVQDMDYQDWRYAIETNLIGYIDCCQQACKRMKKAGGGHIVNIGSISAELRECGEDVYTATKAGIQGFTEAFRKCVNKDGIKVTLIEPGLVGSDMIEMPVEKQRKMAQKMEMLKAEDIAEAVYFCLTQPQRSEVTTLQVRPHRQSTI